MNPAVGDREIHGTKDGASAPDAIEVRGLKKHYGALEAVRGISFEVRRGEIF